MLPTPSREAPALPSLATYHGSTRFEPVSCRRRQNVIRRALHHWAKKMPDTRTTRHPSTVHFQGRAQCRHFRTACHGMGGIGRGTSVNEQTSPGVTRAPSGLTPRPGACAGLLVTAPAHLLGDQAELGEGHEVLAAEVNAAPGVVVQRRRELPLEEVLDPLPCRPGEREGGREGGRAGGPRASRAGLSTRGPVSSMDSSRAPVIDPEGRGSSRWVLPRAQIWSRGLGGMKSRATGENPDASSTSGCL